LTPLVVQMSPLHSREMMGGFTVSSDTLVSHTSVLGITFDVGKSPWREKTPWKPRGVPGQRRSGPTSTQLVAPSRRPPRRPPPTEEFTPRPTSPPPPPLPAGASHLPPLRRFWSFQCTVILSSSTLSIPPEKAKLSAKNSPRRTLSAACDISRNRSCVDVTLLVACTIFPRAKKRKKGTCRIRCRSHSVRAVALSASSSRISGFKPISSTLANPG
jgi:hypothetical protein